MSKPSMTSAATSTILAMLLAAGGVNAQSPSTSSAGVGDRTAVQVGHVDHTRLMDGLLSAAQKLREAIQQLAQQHPGPKRQAAIEAARDALPLTQRAMLQLPPELRVEDVKVREGKDWPKAMARLDSAAQKLRESVEGMSKQPAGKGRDDAIAAVKKALSGAEEAMLALPEYSMKN